MPPQISIIEFNILLVDDDFTSLNIVSSMLKSWQYKVTTANCPFDALAIVRSRNIDLVVSDLHMPKMNGIQLQKQIEIEHKLPVMIMSSDDDQSLILKSLFSGVVFYIVKPVNRDNFKNIWQYAVASRKDKFSSIERIGSLQGQSGSFGINEKISYNDKSNSASSLKGKLGNKKNDKRKSHKKNTKEDVVGENSIAPKKSKVVWTNSLHNRFLQAIRYITLEKAVPKNVLQFMNVPELTRKNVASHLQKYRIFLKRLAEKGFADAFKNSMSIDKAFRSSFAAGHSSLFFKSSQDAYSQFKELEKKTSAITTPFQSNFQPTNFGSIGGLSNSNSSFPLSHTGYGQSHLLGGSTQANIQKPNLSSTNPIYQSNRIDFGLKSNDIETNMLSRGTLSTGIISMQMPSHYNNIATPSFKECGTSGIWNPSYGTPSKNNESTGTGSGSFSNLNLNMKYFKKNNKNNYAEIQINNDGELLAMGGQMIINSNVTNDADFDLINEADRTQGLGVGAVEDSKFGTCLAPGEYSSAGFDHKNQQFPPQFSDVDEQRSTSTSAVPPVAPQKQFGLSSNEQNKFLFDLMNDNNNIASIFDNIANPQPLGELAELLTNEPTIYQLPYQQQGNNDYLTSELNGLLPAENTGLENQGWDDDFLDSLLRDHPY
ncbi:hypothetical protein ACOSQ2_026835 [Xanthoceras sorbifolium]